MAEPLRLYGMKALVTSAAGGIGEAVARTLIKHGAEVLAVDDPRPFPLVLGPRHPGGVAGQVEQRLADLRAREARAAERLQVLPARRARIAERLEAIEAEMWVPEYLPYRSAGD